MYIRYADDFIILTNLSKNANDKIKQDLKKWLFDHRKLIEEKTKITD